MRKLLLFPAFLAVFLLMGAGGISFDAYNGLWKFNTRETLISQNIDPASEEFAFTAQILNSMLSQLTLSLDMAKKEIAFAGLDEEDNNEFTIVSQGEGGIIIDVDGERLLLALAKGFDGKAVLFVSSGEESEEDEEDGNQEERMAFSR